MSTIQTKFVYHLLSANKWQQQSDQLYYTPHDLERVGFIHCCYENQIDYVQRTYFSDKQDVVILKINPEKVEVPVKVEESQPGMKFPHLIGSLNTDAIELVKSLY